MIWQPERAEGDGFAPLERFVEGRDWCFYDVSRLISHRDRAHPTGIDRIDFEYFARLDASMGDRCVAVARIEDGFSLLRPVEKAALLGAMRDRWFAGADKTPDPRSRQLENWGLAPGKWRYDTPTTFPGQQIDYLRWLRAATRIHIASLGRKAARRGHDRRFLESVRSSDTVYITCSHFGLARGKTALERLIDLSSAEPLAYVHDIIPIRRPEYQRPESGPELAVFLKRLAGLGAAFLCNSAATRADFTAWLRAEGYGNDTHVAYPPLDYLRDIPDALAAPPRRDARPYFLCVGTIEPRKNHNLLFDLWRELAAELGARTPTLTLAGSYGWMFDGLKREIEEAEDLRPHILHVRDADDPVLWSLMKHAEALLFPSHCEGFGLPLIEARSMGVSSIVSDIPVFRELRGDGVKLIPVENRAAWKKEILRALAAETQRADGRAG